MDRHNGKLAERQGVARAGPSTTGAATVGCSCCRERWVRGRHHSGATKYSNLFNVKDRVQQLRRTCPSYLAEFSLAGQLTTMLMGTVPD